MSIGQLIEELKFQGIERADLGDDERLQIARFAASFEECQDDLETLLTMTDSDLVATAYWVMVDYARGQV